MFKFATNKLQEGGGGQVLGSGEKSLNGLSDTALASRCRQLIQKDLIAFNKIAD